MKKRASNFAIREGRFDGDGCIQPTPPCAFEHDSLVTRFHSLAHSPKKPPSRPPWSPHFCIGVAVVVSSAISERAESTHSRPTVKYGSNEARQRVSDNVGCGGAYYRIMRPTFNNTPLLDRARSCASIIPRSLSLFSPSALSLYPFPVCISSFVTHRRHSEFCLRLR